MDTNFNEATQGSALQLTMERWRKRLEFKLHVAIIKIDAGVPDSHFDALANEIAEFHQVCAAIRRGVG